MGAFLVIGTTACVNDLNVEPIDPSTNQTVNQDALFNKCYATFALTGQTGVDGNGDVDGIDEGVSSFYRMMFELNEFPADGGWWNWHADAGVNQIYNLTWNSSNSLVAGLYYRLYFDITLCNHFIELFGSSSDDKTQKQVAEVRWIRAINYYYLLDMFQNVPFAETVSTDKPQQISRADLYAWLEKELLDLENNLPAQKVNTYRVDKNAATFLLMRMYLNAEVYTGTAQWDKAAEYAAKIMKSEYGTLAPNYAQLFMGDNQKNAQNTEVLLWIYQGVETESWGGSRFLVCCTRDAGNIAFGSDDSWSCWRTTPTLIELWFDKNEALNILSTAKAAGYKWADETVIPILAEDDRAMFCQSCNKYNSEADTATFTADLNALYTLYDQKKIGDNGATFGNGWTICKWTGIYSDGTPYGSDNKFPDTNIPLLRGSEAYLTYAEAVFRGGAAVNGSAENAIKALRDRAECKKAFTLDEQSLLDEWQREFYSEGRRRTDLVRFGRFTSSDYTWEGKYTSVNERYNVYPLPNADVVANSNLKQYLGY